jgi:hypothetical protein
MKLHASFALAVVCLSSTSPASNAFAAAAQLLDHRERIALVAVDTQTDGNGGDGTFGDHLNLFNRVGTQLGTFDVVGMPTTQPNGGDATGVLTFVASLADGAVMGQGVLEFAEEGPPPPAIMAIVGGTGRYRRVSGYARVVPEGERRANRPASPPVEGEREPFTRARAPRCV